MAVLKTGLTPSASGSAYLELEPSDSPSTTSNSLRPQASRLKLTCTVHGPRPLPRSALFAPQLVMTTRVKFAPFAHRRRGAYLVDPSERDLAVHLESALRGVLIAERWPKSGIDVVVTVLEGEEDGPGQAEGWGAMSILAGCITVASAAIDDAGIDSVDLVTGGVAAVVSGQLVLDPCPSDHDKIDAACVVGYLQSRDEITEIWSRDTVGASALVFEPLIDNAVEAAKAARLVLLESIKESTEEAIRSGELRSNKK